MSTAKERLTGISGVQVNGNTGNHHFNRSFGSQATTTTTTKTTTATATTTTSKTELTSAINSIIGLNAFTKGGAAKRVFKPTIPTTRRSGGGSGVTPGSGGTGGGNGNREGRDQNNSCNGKVKSKEKTRKSKGKKDLIQLDATFNGINITSNSIKPEKGFISPGGSGYGQTSDTRTLRSSQSDSLKGIGSSGTSGCGGGGGSVSLNGCFVKLENSESSYGDNNLKGDDYHKEKDGGDDGIVEEDVEKIQRVLYRDDFVPLYDPNEQDMTPIGWEHVSQHQAFKQEDKKDIKCSLRRFDKWAATKNDQDKMVLFQLPEMLLNSSEGHVGKIRMYQSGKMELVDTRSGLVYDLLHTDCDVNPHPDQDEDENSDDDTTSEDNDDKLKEDTSPSASGESKFSTDWIKKEVDEDDPQNFDFLPPPPIPSRPSTSKSSLSSSPSPSFKMQSPSHSLKSTIKSSSKFSSKNFKANQHNIRRNKCDKDNGNDDDYQDTDTEDDDEDDEDDFNRNITQSYREACTFDGENVVCLGPISNNQLLIGRPRLDKFINL